MKVALTIFIVLLAGCGSISAPQVGCESINAIVALKMARITPSHTRSDVINFLGKSNTYFVEKSDHITLGYLYSSLKGTCDTYKITFSKDDFVTGIQMIPSSL